MHGKAALPAAGGSVRYRDNRYQDRQIRAVHPARGWCSAPLQFEGGRISTLVGRYLSDFLPRQRLEVVQAQHDLRAGGKGSQPRRQLREQLLILAARVEAARIRQIGQIVERLHVAAARAMQRAPGQSQGTLLRSP